MHIEYEEVSGRIKVSYWLESHEWDRFPHSLDVEEDSIWMDEVSIGYVPRSVRRCGEKAIAEWADKKCLEHLEHLHKSVMERYEAQEERMRNVSRPLETKHASGVLLRGHAIYMSHFSGRVDLDKPFALENDETLYIPNRFALGIPMFKWSGELSDEGLVLAKKQLVELYDREMRHRKHGTALNLVEKLNRQRPKS